MDLEIITNRTVSMLGLERLAANLMQNGKRLLKLYTTATKDGRLEDEVTLLGCICSNLDRCIRHAAAITEVSGLGMARSCLLATVLHTLKTLGGCSPDPVLLLQSIVGTLKSSLAELLQANARREELPLWPLTVGGVAAESMPERSWFVGHLVVVVAALSIRTWDEMRQSYTKWAFLDEQHHKWLRTLWSEIMWKQEALFSTPSEAGKVALWFATHSSPISGCLSLPSAGLKA